MGQAGFGVGKGQQIVAVGPGDSGETQVVADPQRMHAITQGADRAQVAEIETGGGADTQCHAMHDYRLAWCELVEYFQGPSGGFQKIFRQQLKHRDLRRRL